MKQSSARFIEKIDLKPIILHEQANKGKTIIEKFTDYSNVSFAVVLLSADDIAYNKNDKFENASFRARQNVIFELGFFIGKIGRESVVVLHEMVENFEIPSDYNGVLYIPYDSSGNWKLSIAKELKAIGYKIDGNKLLE
jgi:predicted nucleotide-binding protein